MKKLSRFLYAVVRLAAYILVAVIVYTMIAAIIFVVFGRRIDTAATTSALLIAVSAAIILLLGIIHLRYTFHGQKLHPRDPLLEERMRQVSPVLTRETTMWKAWVGFNASHSFGAILFGFIYGYLAIVHDALLFRAPFLMLAGLLLLLGYVFLGKRYWFSVPYRGILLASVLYVAALIIRWA